jgi:hypothetical protein
MLSAADKGIMHVSDRTVNDKDAAIPFCPMPLAFAGPH